MVMGSNKKITTIEPRGEVYTCPVCGYTDGFHVSFNFEAGGSSAEVYLICPSCHSRFRAGWTMRSEKA